MFKITVIGLLVLNLLFDISMAKAAGRASRYEEQRRGK